MLLNNNIQFWETNLVCPICKGKLSINELLIFCENCQKKYSFINGVPCFVENSLTEHQKAELEHYLPIMKDITSKKAYYNQIESRYKWALNWINDETINHNSKIICIGGSYLDDLPHVNSNFKFNIDHLAHQFVKYFPEIIDANVKHIASTSENFPFKNEYADIIYSRNSLNHVNNPIKTLLEIYRVLKPNGKFFLSVYYNSFFMNSHETTSIDKEFVEYYLKNLFDTEWIQIRPFKFEKNIFSNWWLRQAWCKGPNFSKPTREKLGWLYAVLKKKKIYKVYNDEILEKYEKLISNFHSALYYLEKQDDITAAKFFEKICDLKPILQTDKMRILYSKVQYLAVRDHKAFIEFFEKFKLSNKDPFWWMVVINASKDFIEKYLHEAIKSYLPIREKIFLENYMKYAKRKDSNKLIKKINHIKDSIYRTIFIFPAWVPLIYYQLEHCFDITKFLEKSTQNLISN